MRGTFLLAAVLTAGWAGGALSAEQGKAALPGLVVPDALGVNIHLTDPRPGEMKMLAEAGFKIVRMDFTWGGTERKKGEYDFRAYERLLAACEPHGIRALFILDYNNKLYDGGLSPHTEEGRAAMAKWAAAAVAHFKGKGILWEMWNEPNIKQFWKPVPNVDDYVKLSNAVGKAIRAAALGELYIGPATSTIDLKFLEGCFQGGCLEYWDAVSVHPYRQKDPETASEEYRELRLLIARYAPKDSSGKRRQIPILSGEWGYSAAWKSFDEVRQGKYLPREFLVNLYNEVPVSIWYDWHDDGKDPKEPEHHFGTVRNAYLKDKDPVYEPKPAYLAARTLTTQLAGFKYNKRLALNDEADWVLLFDKAPDQVRLAAWTTAKEGREVTIPASPGKFTVTNHLGDKTATIEAGKEGLRIRLTDTVQYLVPEKPNDALRVGAAWERIRLEIPVVAPTNVTVSCKAANPLNHPVPLGFSKDDLRLVPPESTPEGKALPERLRAANVNRGVPGFHEVSELFVGPDLRFSQATVVIVKNPLFAGMMAVSDGRLPVLVMNPAGSPFRGVVALTKLEGIAVDPAEQALEMSRGQTQSVVHFNVKRADPVYRGAVVLTDRTYTSKVAWAREDLHATFQFNRLGLAPLQLVPGDASSLPARLKVHADGDRNVKSVHFLTVADPPEPPPSGAEPCLKLSYSFEAGWKFVRVVPATEELKTLPIKPAEFAVWVYGDNSGNHLRVRFTDSSGQIFQASGPAINFKGWRYVTIPMDGRETIHWGGKDGKGDGVVHYPIRWDTLILLDNASRLAGSGEVWFAGLTLIE